MNIDRKLKDIFLEGFCENPAEAVFFWHHKFIFPIDTVILIPV